MASCSPSPQAGGGIGGTGNTASVASGPITGFGSVFVSKYEYDTTTMTVDGKSGSQSDLKKGMVVLVNATLIHNYGTNDPPQRTANRLFYEDTVEGMVQSVAPDGSNLVVLGQTVTITARTIVDATIPEQNILSLVPGRDLVEVSGFITGDGIIVDTLIGLKAEATPDYEVKGIIKNHKVALSTFESAPSPSIITMPTCVRYRITRAIPGTAWWWTSGGARCHREGQGRTTSG